jgi:hypothetical protein
MLLVLLINADESRPARSAAYGHNVACSDAAFRVAGEGAAFDQRHANGRRHKLLAAAGISGAAVLGAGVTPGVTEGSNACLGTSPWPL